MGYLLTTTWFKGVFDIPSNFTDSEDESSCAARRVETLRRTRRDDKERAESEREARLTSDTKNAKARDDRADLAELWADERRAIVETDRAMALCLVS